MLAQTIYRALLHCYPAAFRDEYGNQMLGMFSEQLGEARRTGGRFQAAGLWLGAARDAVTIAPREHCHVIRQDLRYALRTMAARPGFTTVAVLSLALGIGANTAIFSLWNGLLHASLPGVYRPDQLVMLTNPEDQGMWTGDWQSRTDGPRSWLTFAEFEQLRDRAGAFSALMASQSSLDSWQARADGGEWHQAFGRLVSGGYFQVLGVSPLIGRLFTAADDGAESPSAVISNNYWQRRFAGRPDVLGQTLTLGKTPLTIIGVTPPGFIGESSGQQPDLWVPLRLQPRLIPGLDRLHDVPPSKAMWLQVFGSLRPGVSAAQAEAQANAIFHAGLETFYGSIASEQRRRELLDQRLRLQSGARGASGRRSEFSSSLNTLLAAVGVLLLIACANLSNLLLARGALRKPEIALRMSLGAGRGRLVRQLFTESLAIAVIGGVAGLAAAWLFHGTLVGMLAEADRSLHMSFTLHPLVLAFAAAATLSSALLFGILPAWQMTRTGVGAVLKEQGRGITRSSPRMLWSRFLVSFQFALSLPLLFGAGLLVRTVYNLQRADLGFPAEHLFLVRVDLREAGYSPARRDSFLDGLLAEIQRIPGVRAASYSQMGVFSGGRSSTAVEAEGHTARDDRDRNSELDVVGPGYFSALGVPLEIGRDILESDRAGAPLVCVIDETFARRFFDSRNPIGMHITSHGDELRTTYQVVGVVKNSRTETLRGETGPHYFVAGRQLPASLKSPFLLIRAASGSAPVMTAVRRTIERADAALPIESAESIEQVLAPLTAQDRMTAQLAVAFGCVALTLAAIGLYGVLSFGVARRTGEIAVRIALGAQPARVISMILVETAGLVAAGLALGAGLAYVASRIIGSRLYGVAPDDPLTLGLAAALLVLVALSAAFLPAQRASRLDPMAGLRSE